GGKLEMLFPYATLEPIRELLLQRFMGEKFGRDSIWETHLATELWRTRIELNAVLDEQTMLLSEVMNFKVGQTLVFNATPKGNIDLRCGDVSLLSGRLGRSAKTIAVRARAPNARSYGEGMMLGWIRDVVLCRMLLAALAGGFVLNRRLVALRSERGHMEAMIRALT